ncbi:hypothetical protein ID866_10851 [Astraeus odoratus]|nr:hypothetical protein ID866_10851 [Astraeus odoratus]
MWLLQTSPPKLLLTPLHPLSCHVVGWHVSTAMGKALGLQHVCLIILVHPCTSFSLLMLGGNLVSTTGISFHWLVLFMLWNMCRTMCGWQRCLLIAGEHHHTPHWTFHSFILAICCIYGTHGHGNLLCVTFGTTVYPSSHQVLYSIPCTYICML